jgi:hypothetical protein
MAYIGKAPLNGFHAKQSLTGDGSTVTFTLDFQVANETAIIVSVGGVIQEPSEAYNLAIGGTKITFTEAPASTDRVYIQFLGQAIVQNLQDVNGAEFILDLNGNTSFTADTDDEIDIKVGGTDINTIKATGFHNIDSIKYVAGAGDDLEIYHDGTNSLIANKTGTLKVATETSGVPITIGHTTSEVTIADNATVAGNLTVTGTLTQTGSQTFDGGIDVDNFNINGTTIALSSGDMLLDSAGDIILDAAGDTIFLKDAGTTFGSLDNTSGNLIIKSGTTTALTFSGANVTAAGTITGNLTGNASGTALTVTQAAQSAITSLGTLTALTVDDVAIDGKVMTMTGSSGDTFVTTVGTNGATSLVTVDTAAAAAHLTITADGTVDINSAGVLTLDSGAAINIEPASGSAILLDGTISIDAGVVTGATSITSTAFVGALTGNADTATLATTVTITDNESTDENNAIIFTAGGDVDGGNLGLESDGNLTYNPSSGTLNVPNISVTGTQTIVNSVTMNASNAVIFEGSTADAHETTLTTIDATGDRTISLPNVSGTIPVLAAASATAITSTPEELNLLDGVSGLVQADLTKLAAIDATAAEINLIDGGTARGTTAVADADGLLHNDGGTMRMTSAATFKTYFQEGISTAYDDFTVGDAAVTVSTSSGNITVDSIAGAVSIDGHTGVTLASSNSGDITLDSVADINLDAGGADIVFKDDGTQFGKIANSGTHVTIYDGTTLNTTMSGAGITFAGDVTVPNKIIHAGDTNTFIHFPADDRFQVQAGGIEIIDAMNTTQDYLTLGTSSDIDTKIQGGAGFIFLEGSSGNVGYGTTGPDVEHHFDGVIRGNASAVFGTDTDTSNTGNVTLDFAADNNFVLTLTGNTTLVNPTTEQVGQSGFIAFIQDGTGGRTITLGTDYETAGGVGITLTSAASKTDLVPYVVVAAGRILLGQPQKNFS